MTAELAPSLPDVGAASAAPIFVAGPDRSGTTLMFALLASHPDLSMVRRTNMWRYFHDRYGDLGDPGNLDRCLADMTAYRRMRHLEPDEARIREEFARGTPSYGRLFTLFHAHHAQRSGKSRWGDKSLHTEHYAARVHRPAGALTYKGPYLRARLTGGSVASEPFSLVPVPDRHYEPFG